MEQYLIYFSVRVVNEKERERRAPARIEAPKGVGSGEGYPLTSGGRVWGEGRAPSPENFLIFLSGNGAFWCILGPCFNVI